MGTLGSLRSYILSPVFRLRLAYGVARLIDFRVTRRRPGRPPNHIVREYTSFHYRAMNWSKPRRVVAKVEFPPGAHFPRVGFIVTNRSLPNERVLAFYNDHGTAEQHIKEGKHAIKWTRLACMRFAANAVRLQLHALAYNLANFLRTLATPKWIKTWSLTSLRERLIKTGAQLVRHTHYAAYQFAEAASRPLQITTAQNRRAFGELT